MEVYKEVAAINIEACNRSLARRSAGRDLLRTDANARLAFYFMNQQSAWRDRSKPLKWCLFQVSLILQRIAGISTNKSESSFRYRSHPIYFRPGTSDTALIFDVLLKAPNKREYQLRTELHPKVVLDIGANIGITSILLANQYPEAIIHCFEPEARNFSLLSRNVASYPNIRCHSVALSNCDKQGELFYSDNPTNFGGFSLFEKGITKNRRATITIRNVRTYLKELDITEVDLIKIDSEGAEFDILTTMELDMLTRVGWILGELHGERDFELLAYLSTHFDVAISKPLTSRMSMFQARNKRCKTTSP